MAANKERLVSTQNPIKNYKSIPLQYKESGGDENRKIDVVYNCPCNLFVVTGYKDLSDAHIDEKYPYGEIGCVKNVIPHHQAFQKGYSYNIGIIWKF